MLVTAPGHEWVPIVRDEGRVAAAAEATGVGLGIVPVDQAR